jgi:hypothetical protein
MKAAFFKRFRKIFVSILIVLSSYIAWACAGGDWGDGEDSNFAPEAFADSAYKPFFYSSMFYYDINYDTEHNTRFNDSNIQDWRHYLGASVNTGELDYLLNQASRGFIDSVAKSLDATTNTRPPAAKNLAILSRRKDEKVRSFFRYLVHAKACEPFSVREYDYWNYEKTTPTASKPEHAMLYDELNNAFGAAKDDFIKQRYLFQLTRYNYYFNPPVAIKLFETNRNSFTKNIIYYRTMACAAGAFYKQKDYAKANYYYSLVFAGNDKLKTVAHWSFHPQDERDWMQTLKLCTNNEERINLWQMLGIFYKDEMRSIQEIYKLDPKSAKMDVLLTRFVNKNENEYSYEGGKTNQDENIRASLPWLRKVADQGNTANPFLWNTSVGYLHFLSNHFSIAESYYKKAAGHAPNTSLAASQAKILILLNRIGGLKSIQTTDEEKLLPQLQWLYSQVANQSIAKLRYTEAQRWVKATMAKKYRQQNEWVKAECFVSTPVFYISDKNIEQLKTLLSKTDQTPYEKFCASISGKKTEDLWAFQAIHDAFTDNIDMSIKKMERAGKEPGVLLAGNPFNGKIKDCHDCDHTATQKIKYSKLDFLLKLKEMKDNIAKENEVFNNAMLLGNAFYNMSHYGNARYFYESGVLGSGHYSPFSIDSVFVPMLTDNTVARKYYQLALQNAADDEQKAKCNYMIAKCDRNTWYNSHYYSDKENEYKYDEQAETDWKIFDGLSKYGHTKYYQEVLKECGYFATYLKKKK